MADNKIKLCPDNLTGLLAFTAIAALALIISGIALFSFPTEMSEIEVDKQNYTIEYTHCPNLQTQYKTCDEELFANKNKNSCQCLMEAINITEYLHGKVFVHCVLEISHQQDIKIDNSSVETYIDEISNISGQCDPYNTQETTANETCDAIPNSIFNDEFVLYKKNLTIETDYPRFAKEVVFKKAVRWSLNENNSTTGLQNKITVSMNTTEDLSAGQYVLFINNFYPNENIMRRYFILSTQRDVVRIAYSRSRVIEIIAVVLGLVLAAASIALIALRNRIAGVKSNTLTVVTAEPTANNNRLSGTRPEERPLAAHANNEQS